MDYDKTNMPESYDRGRVQPPGVLEMWMERLAAALAGRAISSIVDLGCGTGRFANALADRFHAKVIGIEPSEKMRAHALAKPPHPRVTYVKGTGESIPLPAESTDVIFASMAFHHFADPSGVARECIRVLRADGALCIRNSTRENGSPYERYFPNYKATLDNLPSAGEIVAPFVGSGFWLNRHDTIAHKMADNVIGLAEKASHRADSTLVRLSDSDFARGLANMRAVPANEDGPQMIDIDLFTFTKVTHPACGIA